MQSTVQNTPISSLTPQNQTQAEMLQIQTPVQIQQVESELNKTDWIAYLIKVEKLFLRLISVGLLIHGLNGIYHELVDIFYVFPHLPVLFEEIGYAQTAFRSLYQKSVLITATAALETIYGIAVLSRMKHLAHRLHIISGIALFVISLLIARQNQRLEALDSHHRIPKAPTIVNLLEAENNQERVDLFVVKPVAEIEATN